MLHTQEDDVIGIIQHPKSGEVYAVEYRDASIVRAAGPLHHGESRDSSNLRSWLDSGDDDPGDTGTTPTMELAAWLTGELA